MRPAGGAFSVKGSVAVEGFGSGGFCGLLLSKVLPFSRVLGKGVMVSRSQVRQWAELFGIL